MALERKKEDQLDTRMVLKFRICAQTMAYSVKTMSCRQWLQCHVFWRQGKMTLAAGWLSQPRWPWSERGKEKNSLIILSNYYHAGQKCIEENAITLERLYLHFQEYNAGGDLEQYLDLIYLILNLQRVSYTIQQVLINLKGLKSYRICSLTTVELLEINSRGKFGNPQIFGN